MSDDRDSRRMITWSRRLIGLLGVAAAAGIFAVSGRVSGLITRSEAATILTFVGCAFAFVVIVWLGHKVEKRR